jgi:hypothetical protein
MSWCCEMPSCNCELHNGHDIIVSYTVTGPGYDFGYAVYTSMDKTEV